MPRGERAARAQIEDERFRRFVDSDVEVASCIGPATFDDVAEFNGASMCPRELVVSGESCHERGRFSRHRRTPNAPIRSESDRRNIERRRAGALTVTSRSRGKGRAA